MKMSFADKNKGLPKGAWMSDTVSIRRIENDDDLWYAVMECRLQLELLYRQEIPRVGLWKGGRKTCHKNIKSS